MTINMVKDRIIQDNGNNLLRTNSWIMSKIYACNQGISSFVSINPFEEWIVLVTLDDFPPFHFPCYTN